MFYLELTLHSTHFRLRAQTQASVLASDRTSNIYVAASSELLANKE